MIDVVIVGYRPGEETHRLLAEIRSVTFQAMTVFFVDNTRNPETLSGAWNRLAGLGSAPYLAFLNPDVVLCPGWDILLTGCLERRPEVGAAVSSAIYDGCKDFGTVLRIKSPPSQADMKSWVSRFSGREEIEAKTYPFFCVVCRRKTFEELFGFDERLRFYGQDHDFQDRLIYRGLKTILVNECPVFNGGSIATQRAIHFRDINIDSEYRHCTAVLKSLRSNQLKLWHDLTDQERRRIRLDPAYRMSVGKA